LICFDIAFPLSYLKEVRESDFIVNISNDTWFGSSYGPYQHLQIVRAGHWSPINGLQEAPQMEYRQ
jgi:apolipoprotein N-acyltransferase